MKEVDMSGSEALLLKDRFDTAEMIEAIAKDLYKNMVARIEEAKPEFEFDRVHKLAIMNAAEFCKQCIDETDGRYEQPEKLIMAMVGKRLIEMLEDAILNNPDADNE
jgi:hypothetical protein